MIIFIDETSFQKKDLLRKTYSAPNEYVQLPGYQFSASNACCLAGISANGLEYYSLFKGFLNTDLYIGLLDQMFR